MILVATHGNSGIREKMLNLVVKQGSAGVNGIREADSSRLRKEEVQVMNLSNGHKT